MRRADGLHNTRLSTSWREVISHLPRGIPCFDRTVLMRRTTASRVVCDDARSNHRRRRSAMVTRGFKARQSGSELSDRIPPGQHLVDNFPVLIDPADWNF